MLLSGRAFASVSQLFVVSCHLFHFSSICVGFGSRAAPRELFDRGPGSLCANRTRCSCNALCACDTFCVLFFVRTQHEIISTASLVYC